MNSKYKNVNSKNEIHIPEQTLSDATIQPVRINLTPRQKPQT
jgi:hypothetical protein